ncbi:hypothetical protein MVEN_00260500 [Mycena venus]|uniref:Uncharacterized protein n=1 Tax=Mycena venus TaxID=2733690 RepID=A0A8H6Z277_9AGAR|nr:hypothetical protein MVEN_00260500 [Mycena venus]
MDPLLPPIYHSINTSLTPIFVPDTHSVLAIESYFGLGGPGFTAAFLYNPLDPNSGIAVDERGRLVPVLEARWREFEHAVAGAQGALMNTWGVGSWWSRPQNTTCPEDVFYDIGPAAATDKLTRFGISGHTVAPRWGQPDDVQWYKPVDDPADVPVIKVVDAVPPPFLEVERIIRDLREELLPWDYSQPITPIPVDVQAMLRAIATMARIKRWWWKGY